MPAPSQGHLRFQCARQNRSEQRKPTLFQEVCAQLYRGKIFEKVACFSSRINSRQWIARAVSVSAQEFFRVQVSRLDLQLSRVCTQSVFRFTSQEIDELNARVPPQQVYAGAAKDRNINAVVVRVAMVEHDNRLAARAKNAVDFAHCCGCIRRVMKYAVRVNNVE